MVISMDELDTQILQALKRDSRMSHTALAEIVDTSEGTIRSRMKRLTDSGIIRQFTLRTSGFGVKALLDISIGMNVNTTEVSSRIAAIQGVDQVFETAGEFDITIVIDVPTIMELNEIIERIRAMENTMSTKTRLILKEVPISL